MEDHDGTRSLRNLFWAHPLLSLCVIALALRLLLAPFFTYDFDVYHWGIILENFQSGNGLYQVAGYYYTPVWGYILGFISVIQNMFLNMDAYGWKITALIPMEMLNCRYHISVETTIQFIMSMKVPLIVCDIVVAYLLFWIVRERGDTRKATYAAALWLFCPTVVYMSGVQVQFDTISALFMLITAILVYKDRCFLAGMMFAVSVLLKFFPGFCILVLIGYVYAKHRGDGEYLNRIMQSLLGAAIMALVIIIPQIMDGTVYDSLSFVIGRMGSPTDLISQLQSYTGILIALCGMVWFGMKMFRSRDDPDSDQFLCLFGALASSMLISSTPQYMIVVMPLLIYHTVMCDRRFRICWLLISLGTFGAAISINNFSLLASISAYTGLVDPATVIGLMQGMESIIFFGIDLVVFLNSAGCYFCIIGFILVLLLLFEEQVAKVSPPLGRWMKKL